MDSLSSSFLQTFPIDSKTHHHHHPAAAAAKTSNTLKVSSVQTEDKPQTPPLPPQPPFKKKATPSAALKAAPQATILNAADSFINTFIDPPIKPSVDPRHVLSDNFAPVDELPPTECQVVEGALPPSLNGAYIRNGPNPQFLPRGPYHLFDGDGMLHALRISDGRATLCSRYVKTYKYTVEKSKGYPVMPSIFSGFNGAAASAARGAVTAARVLAGEFDPGNGIGVANTSLALIGSRLYALGD